MGLRLLTSVRADTGAAVAAPRGAPRGVNVPNPSAPIVKLLALALALLASVTFVPAAQKGFAAHAAAALELAATSRCASASSVCAFSSRARARLPSADMGPDTDRSMSPGFSGFIQPGFAILCVWSGFVFATLFFPPLKAAGTQI